MPFILKSKLSCDNVLAEYLNVPLKYLGARNPANCYNMEAWFLNVHF